MLKIRQLKVPVLDDNEKFLKKVIAKKLHVNVNMINNYKIQKKSIDARDKNNVLFIYEVIVSISSEEKVLEKYKSNDILKYQDETYEIPKKGINKLDNRIVIVGSGPAGLFTALILSEAGYKPLIIERGEGMEERIITVNNFWQTGKLDLNSNVQFGEGGAGTFSDAKLSTLVNDKFCRGKKVLETFVKYGAPQDILYLQYPHVGTDIIRKVIINMRNDIKKKGGEFYYNSCLTDLIIENNTLKAIEINNKQKIACDNLVLAIGHSARDTFSLLLKKKLDIKSKPFAIGIRIEHLQEMINYSQYGKYAKYLPPASYKLTYTTSLERGVYSFCMCPGGFVVNASSEKNRLVINGMSNYKRDSLNANSALIVTVSPKDYGTHPFDGINFQRRIEEKAYKAGNGKIPLQLYRDYLNNKVSSNFGSFKTEVKGDYCFANLNDILPDYINNSLKEAMKNFGQKIKGFDSDDAILTGVEMRSSSPIRIMRDDDFEANIKGIYPCGEGAGYAGGIMTSAIDGIKVAEALIKKYSSE